MQMDVGVLNLVIVHKRVFANLPTLSFSDSQHSLAGEGTAIQMVFINAYLFNVNSQVKLWKLTQYLLSSYGKFSYSSKSYMGNFLRPPPPSLLTFRPYPSQTVITSLHMKGQLYRWFINAYLFNVNSQVTFNIEHKN